MTTQYFHSKVNDIVPFNATYTWPSQATKVHKQTVKLIPKNSTSFDPGQTVRFEFPSDGYLNTLNSRLTFDLTVTSARPSRKITIKPSGASDAVVAGECKLSVPTGETAFTTAEGLKNGLVGYVLSTPLGDFRVIKSGAVAAGVIIASVMGEQEGVPILFPSKDIIPTSSTTGAETASEVISLTGFLSPGIRLGPAGAQELISRETVWYGGARLEDITERNLLARGLQNMGMSSGHLDSVGKNSEIRKGSGISEFGPGQGLQSVKIDGGNEYQAIQAGKTVRVSVPLLSGLFNCHKLIPLKWMAAQWSLEMTMAAAAEAFIVPRHSIADDSFTYKITNVQYIAELVEFPDTYDTAFFVGLNNGGVPIKFTTWKHHNANITGTTTHHQIHERARSIKAGFAYVTHRGSRRLRGADSLRSYYNLTQTPVEVAAAAADDNVRLQTDGVIYRPDTTTDAYITEYQYRVGGSWFPAQPVDCRFGAVEAYNEMLKAVDGMSDFTFQNNMQPHQWTSHPYLAGGGDKFMMALEFEHGDVLPDSITGISGEEQSDIALSVKLSNAPPGDKELNVFLAVDSLIIVETGNAVKLIL